MVIGKASTITAPYQFPREEEVADRVTLSWGYTPSPSRRGGGWEIIMGIDVGVEDQGRHRLPTSTQENHRVRCVCVCMCVCVEGGEGGKGINQQDI